MASTAARTSAEQQLQLDLGFVSDDNDGSNGWFDTLVAINQRWLGNYARVNPAYGVSLSLLERNSLWMNTYFQKQRMITSSVSKQAKSLLQLHQQTVLMRLRSGGGPRLSEAEGSTALVEPMAALMFAASADRCPEYQIENLLLEAKDLLQCQSLREQALRSGFAGCVFRYLTTFSEIKKRVLALQLLVLLASQDAAAVVQSCKVASQGQLWQPNMFIYTLQKRHHDNDEIRDLAAELLVHFAGEMPITSPIQLDAALYDSEHNTDSDDRDAERLQIAQPSPPPNRRTYTLPALGSPSTMRTQPMSPHRPTTTISSLYVGSPSPYSREVVLPIARPPPSAAEQARRSNIYSTPKEKAIAGDRKRRCLTPNIQPIERDPSETDDLGWMAGSPPRSPTSPRLDKKPITLSEKYSWNPDCINSVSGFEWWWRSLPQHHTNLEPTQKLKMVTKAAVRLHTKGEWERAVELYLLALSMDINDEVQFRLRVNLGCAYEVGLEFSASATEFRAALRVNPDDAYARFKLGWALKELGQFEEAAALFQGVREVYPQAEDALTQLEEARDQKTKQEETERSALAAVRTARSPSKPGRRLHSRGQAASQTTLACSSTSSFLPCLPQILQPTALAESPRMATKPSEQLPPLVALDLISCISSCCLQTKLSLRDALYEIDTMRSGRVRLTALAKLITVLCGMDEAVFYGWLPHDAVVVEDGDASSRGGGGERGSMVRYEELLTALESDAQKKEAESAHTWRSLVESVKNEEADIYNEAIASQTPVVANVQHKLEAPVERAAAGAPEEISECDDVADRSGATTTTTPTTTASSNSDKSSTDVTPEAAGGNGGPSADDLQSDDIAESVTPLTSSTPEPAAGAEDEISKSAMSQAVKLAMVVRRASVEELGGYHSMSARLDEKREKARQEAILRAERSRVVARKQLFCLKAMQEVASRARRHLMRQHEARVQLQTMGTEAVAKVEVQTTQAQSLAQAQHTSHTSVAAIDTTPQLPYTVPAIVLLAPLSGEDSADDSHDDEDSSDDAVAVAAVCQQLVVAVARDALVAQSVKNLRLLVAAFSATCDRVPELLRQHATQNEID